jgi:NAD+ synthase (glutamine-hydrolysing)
MNILISQSGPRVGNFTYNIKLIQDSINSAIAKNCELVVTPEFSLCGYPPEDLLFRDEFFRQIALHVADLQRTVNGTGVSILIGLPRRSDKNIYNSMALLAPNLEPIYCDKVALPNYGVFDEKRYFTSGRGPSSIRVGTTNFVVLVCEDIWDDSISSIVKQMDVDAVISVNASPFDDGKARQREILLTKRCLELKLPILYLNMVSGQDELVFDGGSFALNQDAELTLRAPIFETKDLFVEFTGRSFYGPISQNLASDEKLIVDALVFSLSEYYIKNKFERLFIGLSGGIDSALVLALSVLAVGQESVCAIMMPTRYTSEMSLIDAKQLAINLGVDYKVLQIEDLCDSYSNLLEPEFIQKKIDITEENIQARIRGVILMAFANKFKGMVVSTGNKSEISVGYCTIYGDMAGGFALIKDVYKTHVYRLCKYLNKQNPIIPENIISRAPSAELRFDQKDEDSLPPYDVLDDILKFHIEMNYTEFEIVNRGYPQELVERILRLVQISEYKRKQSPIGPKITQRSFGKDWRLPISY